MRLLLGMIQGTAPTPARAGKKTSVDFQKTSDRFITYILTYQAVRYLDFLFHVDLKLCSETHPSAPLYEDPGLMGATVRARKAARHSKRPLQCLGDVT